MFSVQISGCGLCCGLFFKLCGFSFSNLLGNSFISLLGSIISGSLIKGIMLFWATHAIHLKGQTVRKKSTYLFKRSLVNFVVPPENVLSRGNFVEEYGYTNVKHPTCSFDFVSNLVAPVPASHLRCELGFSFVLQFAIAKTV